MIVTNDNATNIKAKLKGTTKYKDNFLIRRAILPVSVNQTYHEGQKLEANFVLSEV